MPYIGKSPVSGGFHKLDALTASATATYALTLGSAAYFPETANQLLVSLNGVIQAPQDSFTVSGSNLIFDTALTASDSIDFVVALGDVLGVQGVTDGAVTTAKLGNSAVTDAKIDTMAASKLTGTINSGRFPSGSIIQTQYTQIDATSQWTCGANTDKEISVLAVNITPASTNSIIKIEAMVNGEWGNHGATYNSTWFFYRDSTKLSAPAAGSRNVGIMMGTSLSYPATDASSTPETANYMYFDTPSTTSQITYKVGVKQSLGSAIYWNLNRCVTDADVADQERGMSLICVTEIAG
jgi:hypothetical protein